MKTFLTLMMTGCLAVGLVTAQSRSAADQYQEALRLEEIKGDLKAAIEQYEKVIADARASRSLKATALLHLGRSYEKLGDAEAAKAYERVAREFADQVDSAALARTQLAVLAKSGDGRQARRVWEDAPVDSARSATISRDGRYLVYQGPNERSDLYVRDLRTGLNRRLESVTDMTYLPIFSPDGRQVAYGRSVDGGVELRLKTLDASTARRLQGGNEWGVLSPRDWSADGKQILALGRRNTSSQPNIVLVSVADGSVRALKAITYRDLDPPRRIGFSPDGRFVVYDYPARGDSGERDIFILATAGGQETRLVIRPSDERYPFFTPDGMGVLFLSNAGGTIGAWFQRVVEGKPQGTPELQKPDMGENAVPIGFASNGSFYYSNREATDKLFMATLDQSSETVVVPPDTFTQRVITSGPTWSPDGQYLAYGSQRASVKGESGARIVVIRALANGEERDLTPSLSTFRGTGEWSPDGRSLLTAGTDKAGRTGLYRVDVRTGDATSLLNGIPSHFKWFLNGRALVFIRGGAIVLHDLDSGRDTELYKPTAPLLLGSCLEVSANGQRLAFYIDDRTSRSMSVMVMDAPGTAPRQLGPSVKYPERIDDILALTPDGRQVFYTTYDQTSAGQSRPAQLHKVRRIAVDGGTSQEIQLPMQKLGYVGLASVHPDGQRIAFKASTPSKQSVWVLENFLPKARAAR